MIAALSTAPAAFAGEVIDGIVATVNHAPLLRSDWDEAVRFEAFMQQKRLAEVTDRRPRRCFAPHDRPPALEGADAEVRYMRPSDADLAADIEKLRSQIPGADNPQGWSKSLASLRPHRSQSSRITCATKCR